MTDSPSGEHAAKTAAGIIAVPRVEQIAPPASTNGAVGDGAAAALGDEMHVAANTDDEVDSDPYLLGEHGPLSAAVVGATCGDRRARLFL